MTPPAGVPDALDLTVDPQLVHDLAEEIDAGVGDERPQILRFVDTSRLHSVQDGARVFAQRMHVSVSVSGRLIPSTAGQVELAPFSLIGLRHRRFGRRTGSALADGVEVAEEPYARRALGNELDFEAECDPGARM